MISLKKNKKIKIFLFFGIFFLSILFIQESLFEGILSFLGFPFYLYLIILFPFLVFDQKNLGLFLALISGLVLDFFSLNPFGIFGLSLGMSAFLITKISYLFQKSNILAFLFLFGIFFLFSKLFLIFNHFLFEFLLELL